MMPLAVSFLSKESCERITELLVSIAGMLAAADVNEWYMENLETGERLAGLLDGDNNTGVDSDDED